MAIEEEPKVYTFAEGQRRYDDGYRDGKDIVWFRAEEIAGYVFGGVFAAYMIFSLVYTTAGICGWLKG